jgi:hypothetical protein
MTIKKQPKISKISGGFNFLDHTQVYSLNKNNLFSIFSAHPFLSFPLSLSNLYLLPSFSDIIIIIIIRLSRNVKWNEVYAWCKVK